MTHAEVFVCSFGYWHLQWSYAETAELADSEQDGYRGGWT